jgi:hypothetical protein
MAIRHSHALFEERKREAAFQRLRRILEIHREKLAKEDDNEDGWSS